MSRIAAYFQHVFNPLHVFCRLCDAGVKTDNARRMSQAYERMVFRRIPFCRVMGGSRREC
jgi:hypothetical protein